MFGRMLLLSEQEYDHIFATTGLDADGRRQNMAIFSTRMELYIRACAKFAKKIPGFAYLDIQDQVTLIKCKRHFLCVGIYVPNIKVAIHISFPFKVVLVYHHRYHFLYIPPYCKTDLTLLFLRAILCVASLLVCHRSYDRSKPLELMHSMEQNVNIKTACDRSINADIVTVVAS